jgi:hypothetical protein
MGGFSESVDLPQCFLAWLPFYGQEFHARNSSGGWLADRCVVPTSMFTICGHILQRNLVSVTLMGASYISALMIKARQYRND